LKCVCSLLLFTPAVFAAVEKVPARTAILPLVTFYSSLGEGEVYNWWAENSSSTEMKTLFLNWYRHVAQNPLSRWEYLSTLQKDELPDFQVTAMSFEKQIEFAKHKSAGLLITGDVRIEPSPMIAQGVRWIQKLEVFRVKNAQKIGETLRIYDFPKYQFTQLLLAVEFTKEFMPQTVIDLHAKIENYKPEKAEVSTKLILTGDLSSEQIDKIKNRLQESMRDVESAQVLSYERNQVVFEFKGINSQKLSQTLEEFHWKGFLTQIISSDSSQVVFDVHSKNRVQ
jgi:hypothetical protein